MEGTSLQADRSLLHESARRKRSFSLPRFGRLSAGERADSAKQTVGDEAKTAEGAVRAQKAAAWQWYTRGVGEVVLATRRPSTATPSENKSVFDNSGKNAGDQHTVQKKHLEASPRVVSRFKAEASSFTGPLSGDAHPNLSAATPSTPLYDEVELSGLRTQMADFVNRLQQEESKDKGQPPAGNVAEDAKSIKPPAQCTAPQGRPSVVSDPAATPASSTDHLRMPKVPPAATAEAGGGSAAANSADRQSTRPLSSLMPINSTNPFSMRPFSALHKIFRKVVSGSILKSSKTSPITSNPPTPAAIYHPEVLASCEEEHAQYHHHHYIHHHHHHYHYGQSSEKSTAILRSRQRHSQSSDIRPRIPSILEADSGEEEEVETSPIDAFLARRRRRHSDTLKKSDFDGEIRVKVEAETPALMLPLRSPRRYNSGRFSPNMVRSTESQELQGSRVDDFQERLQDIKSRRYFANHQSSRLGAEELAGLEKRLGGGGGKTGRGRYKLGGGEEGTIPVVAHVRRRRHSEGFQRQPEEAAARYEMEKSTPSPAGRSYWQSSSARYLEDVLERQMGISAMANGGPARRAPAPRLTRELPPLYPQ